MGFKSNLAHLCHFKKCNLNPRQACQAQTQLCPNYTLPPSPQNILNYQPSKSSVKWPHHNLQCYPKKKNLKSRSFPSNHIPTSQHQVSYTQPQYITWPLIQNPDSWISLRHNLFSKEHRHTMHQVLSSQCILFLCSQTWVLFEA